MLGLGIGLHKDTPKKAIARNGLVLYLNGKDFLNSPPTTMWLDKSGLGNNATPSNLAYNAASGSDGSGGVVLDGVDDKITSSLTSTFNANDFTVSATFTPLKIHTTTSGLIAKRDAGADTANYVFTIEANNNYNFRVYGQDSNFYGSTSTTALTVGTKYNITNIRRGNLLNTYINGVLDRSVTLPAGYLIRNNYNVLNIGYYASNTNIKLYNVLMYNRALTDQEILQNYNATK